MKRFLLIAVATCAAGLMACGGEASKESADASEDSVIGVTNLDTMEASFGLEKGTVDRKALLDGQCYKAFIDDGDPDTWTPGEFEFRAYKNGAAYFAKKESGYNTGDYRPVLCVDFHPAYGTTASLSGVALDASWRFSLGKVTGKSAAPEGLFNIDFERGQLTIDGSADAKSRYAAALKRPTLVELDDAPTVMGQLKHVKVKGVYTDVMFDQPHAVEHYIPGYQAFFAYRFAWRAQENSGYFTTGGDRLGQLKDDMGDTVPVAHKMGDGPGWAVSLFHARGNLVRGGFSVYDEENDDDAGTEQFLRIARPESLEQQGPSNQRPDHAECTRMTRWDEARQIDVPTSPWNCTGI